MENTLEKKGLSFYAYMNLFYLVMVITGSIYFPYGGSKFKELMVIICTGLFGVEMLCLIFTKTGAEKVQAAAMRQGKIPRDNKDLKLFKWQTSVIAIAILAAITFTRELPKKYQVGALLFLCFVVGAGLIIHGLRFFKKMRDLGLKDEVDDRRSDFIQFSIGAGIFFLGALSCGIQTVL